MQEHESDPALTKAAGGQLAPGHEVARGGCNTSGPLSIAGRGMVECGQHWEVLRIGVVSEGYGRWDGD